MQMYKHMHNKKMSTPAVTQMLSILMYNRRFFPNYVSNILGGIDENGKGVVYSYDPVGHTERTTYRAGGSAGPLLQPVLDSQVGLKNQVGAMRNPFHLNGLSVRDTSISAAERDMMTRDGVIFNIITKDGNKQERRIEKGLKVEVHRNVLVIHKT